MARIEVVRYMRQCLRLVNIEIDSFEQQVTIPALVYSFFGIIERCLIVKVLCSKATDCATKAKVLQHVALSHHAPHNAHKNSSCSKHPSLDSVPSNPSRAAESHCHHSGFQFCAHEGFCQSPNMPKRHDCLSVWQFLPVRVQLQHLHTI